MIADTTYTIAPVRQRDGRLAALTYPRWRKVLMPDANAEDTGLRPPFAAIAAWDSDTPLGLALTIHDAQWPAARLASVFVVPAHRRRGIGLALLAAVEQYQREQGKGELMALHTDGLPARVAFEALLRAGGWDAPQLYRLRLAGRADWVTTAERDWAPILARLQRQGWSATPWAAADEADLARVDALAATAPELMRPLPDQPRYEASSLLLRRRDEVVGWIQAVEEIQPRHILYPVGYVIPELQRSAWLVAGLVAACRRQMDALGGDSVCHYETAADNKAMQGIMLNRLADRDGLLTIDRQYESRKILA
ncbi:hypothetical protein DLREEDagrD3_11550 [Denitratisoma sp. agr-D3]